MTAPTSTSTTSTMPARRPHPGTGRGFRISVVVAVVMAGLVALPGLIGLDGMEGGYALSFVAAFGVISASIVAVMLRFRDLRRTALLKEPERVEWVVDAARWRLFLASETGTVAAEQRATYWLVGIIIVVVTIGFVAWRRDEASLVVAGVMAALLVVLKLVSLGGQRHRERLLRDSPPVIVVGRRGILLGEAFFDLGARGTRLEGVGRERDDDGGAMLVAFSTPSRAGRQTQEVRIPLPDDGSDTLADAISARLNARR